MIAVLDAYTSVPIADTSAFVPTEFGDELPMAQTTASQYLNIRNHTVAAALVSPVESICQQLAVTKEPGHAAGNAYWMLALDQTAAAAGAAVLVSANTATAASRGMAACSRNR